MDLNYICIQIIDRGSKKGLSIFINEIDTNAVTGYGFLNIPCHSNFGADVNHFAAMSSKTVKTLRKENDHED